MKHIALQLEFESDKFRLTGPIPEDSNAGNKFYGEDFAKWLCKSLPKWHLDYLDEDWGWYIFSVRGETPNDETNEICVYAYPEEGGRQLNDNGKWMLIVHTRFKIRWMHFFKRWTGGAFNRTLGADLLRALQALCNKEHEGDRDVARQCWKHEPAERVRSELVAVSRLMSKTNQGETSFRNSPERHCPFFFNANSRSSPK